MRDQLDFKLLSSRVDDQGRYILLHAMIQDTPFLLINIYAPNKCAEQSEFFKSISNEIKTCVTLDCSIVLGGDFNVTFDPELDGNSVPILDISSKQIYEIFLGKKQILPNAQRKLTDKYPDINVEWDKVYSLPFRSTLDSKTREFQYKILNCIVYTNEKLYRFGLVASPSCTFCQKSAESIEHLLFSCKISSEFWKHVLSWLKDNGIDIETLREWDIIFGKFDIKDNFTLVNHLLLLGKYYIYSKKCQNSLPTVQGFIARIKLIYRIELQIAREKNKLSQHFIKWRKLVEVLV